MIGKYLFKYFKLKNKNKKSNYYKFEVLNSFTLYF